MTPEQILELLQQALDAIRAYSAPDNIVKSGVDAYMQSAGDSVDQAMLKINFAIDLEDNY